MPARRHDPALDLDLSVLPPAVRAQFNEHLTGLAQLCREHQLDATQVGQAVTIAVTKRLSSQLCEDCDKKGPSFGMKDEHPEASGSHRTVQSRLRWCSGCAKAHAGAVNLKNWNSRCEDCGLNQGHYGLESERKKRWCRPCAKAHTGAVSLQKQCEDCAMKTPSFGTEDERKIRWCSLCAKAHAGAVYLSTVGKVQCEDCGLHHKAFGMEDERVRRWCKGCAKAHGAVSLHRQCEDCALKVPSFGIEDDERKKRWCSGCAKAHAGAVFLAHNSHACHDCGLKVRNYGLESERKTRWCAACGKAHGAVHQRKWRAASKARGEYMSSARQKREAGFISTAAATKRRLGQSDC